MEDNKFVLHGPELAEPIPQLSLGREFFNSLSQEGTNYLAMVDAITEKTLSYRELFQQTVKLAEALRKYGYQKGTVIAISSENSLEYFIPVVASLYNASIIAPFNPTYTATELRHTLNISQPKVVFCSFNSYKKFVELRNELRFIEKIVVLNSLEIIEGAQTLPDFLSGTLETKSSIKFEPYDVDPNKTPAYIFYSSGTTGLPKGVCLSHQNVLVRNIQSRDQRYFSLEDKVGLGVMPFFHAYGQITAISNILNKITIVVFQKFDGNLFLKSIQYYKITQMFIAPPIAVFLAKSPLVEKCDLSCVKSIMCAAAPLSANIEKHVLRRLRNLNNLRQGYGLTELTLAALVVKPEENIPGSVGSLISSMSCKVRDPETGKTLGPNQVGELCFKGPLVMMGYYKNERATRETFTSDGWLRTGDLGYYDDKYYFYIVGRLKELIKYKGFQVPPAELEAILLKHPNIVDVGVVGLPDELCGELPIAFVVRKEGAQITEQEIQDYVAREVSPQKKLRGGVIFVSSIPKNPSGKILRRELNEMLKNLKSKL